MGILLHRLEALLDAWRSYYNIQRARQPPFPGTLMTSNGYSQAIEALLFQGLLKGNPSPARTP